MRCLTLAQVLKKNTIKVEFICRKHDGNLIEKIRIDGFNVFELDLPQNVQIDNKLAHSHWLGVTQQQDANECISILQPEKVDWIIVDHYALDEDWHQELRHYCHKMMVIDDIADRKFQCDVLLNQNLGVCKVDYKNKIVDGCVLLLGCGYALLRSEFEDLRELAIKKREKTKAIKNILISMGGGDPENITFDVLQNIDNALNTIVVLGLSSPHVQMIKRYAIGKNIKVLVDVKNMADFMLDADLAIGAGGSTSWERCCLGLPTLLHIAADNQKSIAKKLERIGAVKIIENLKPDLDFLLNNLNVWKIMSRKSSGVCNGRGTMKVAKYLL
jgi:UDP-2,4-diacetamido-2,4,6-trideoxy-beta-L-altropyranose hydrolase